MSDQVISPNDGWLTAAEAAKYLKVRSRTLLQRVREGSIKGYCLHGHRPADDFGNRSGEDQIIIAKKRRGATGALNVVFDWRKMQFKER